MQVHYDEGVAIHVGPEPCVGVRKDVDEASVGEGIGQPSSRESQSPGADAVSSAEGNTTDIRCAPACRAARRARRLFNHLVGQREQFVRNLDAERLRSL